MKAARGVVLIAEENSQVYIELLLSCQDDLTFKMIDEVTSKTFSEGDARVVRKHLKHHFELAAGHWRSEQGSVEAGHSSTLCLERVKTQTSGLPSWIGLAED